MVYIDDNDTNMMKMMMIIITETVFPEHKESVGVPLQELRARVPVVVASSSHLSRFRGRAIPQRTAGSCPRFPVNRWNEELAAGSRSHSKVSHIRYFSMTFNTPAFSFSNPVCTCCLSYVGYSVWVRRSLRSHYHDQMNSGYWHLTY